MLPFPWPIAMSAAEAERVQKRIGGMQMEWAKTPLLTTATAHTGCFKDNLGAGKVPSDSETFRNILKDYETS